MTENQSTSQQVNDKKKIGRKPIDNKKLPITIYRTKSEIEKMGGLQKSREILNNLLDNAFENNSITQ